jgi:DDE superfamily endonuclease
VRALVPADAPILLAVDDSLFKRRGRKIFGAAWHHDAAAPGHNRVAWGNSWVVVGVLVHLPFVPHRMVCLPVLARLWQPTITRKGRKARRARHARATADRPAKLTLARQLVEQICARYPSRQVHLVGDAAYLGRTWRNPPANLTVTSRLRCDAALYELAPPRTGKPGRPRVKGKRLPGLIVLAGMTTVAWERATVCCYGRQRTLDLAYSA